jgi:STE24 endopeptidase
VAGAAAEPLHAALQPTAAVLVYLACLGAIHEVGALPFACYRSFLLERRYGLSTERFSHWLRDQAKGLGLGALLSGAGFSLLYAVIRLTPDWCAAATAGFGLVAAASRLAPVLLLPLFFTFQPWRGEPEGTAHRPVVRAGVAVTDVCEWQVSDRTKANAALAGIGRTRPSVGHPAGGAPDEEIEVALAHELGHQVHHDVEGSRSRRLAGPRSLPPVDGAAFTSRLGLRPADIAGLPPPRSRRPAAPRWCLSPPRRRGPWNGRRTGLHSN